MIVVKLKSKLQCVRRLLEKVRVIDSAYPSRFNSCITHILLTQLTESEIVYHNHVLVGLDSVVACKMKSVTP